MPILNPLNYVQVKRVVNVPLAGPVRPTALYYLEERRYHFQVYVLEEIHTTLRSLESEYLLTRFYHSN